MRQTCRLILLAGLAGVLFVPGCAGPGSKPGMGELRPRSFAYVLQADRLTKRRENAVEILKRSGRDLIVLDSAYSDGAGGRWQAAEIREIRGWKKGRRVVAYLSIGEAEKYRSYWRKEWDPDGNGVPELTAPSFLCRENPDWEGNYKVKYWDGRWQQIIMSAVDEIADQGFDGLYLDIVDGFEFFEKVGAKYVDDRVNVDTGRTFRQDMVRFVQTIARHARERGGEGFLIIPQNGAQLLAQPGYAETINAIAAEDLFTNGRQPRAADETEFTLGFLRKFQQTGKPVILVEYASKPGLRKQLFRLAAKHRLLLLLTGRGLTDVGTVPHADW